MPRAHSPAPAPARVAPPADADKAFQFSSLSAYPFKKRMTIRAVDLALYGVIRTLGRTVRFEVEGWHHYEAVTRAGHLPVGAFWHDNIALATYFWRDRGFVVMTSQSFDGEYIARLIQRFGFGVARGSSTRGSVGAVVSMVREMRQGRPTAFTIDGPKGPRHVAKMGAVLLAKKTGHPVMPFAITPDRAWTLRSWDAMTIPKPFTRARVEIGTPLYVPADADEAALERHLATLQGSLDALTRRGEEWREALDGPPATQTPSLRTG